MAVSVSAQVTSPTQDVLGAHNVYGRGCVACHAPHSGAAGNGAPSSANSGNLALWGENLVPLYGQTLSFGDGGAYTVSIPNYFPTSGAFVNGVAPTGLPGSLHTAEGGLFVIAACLSCHDGNVATSAMMKGTTVETVTINGAIFNPPTLLGNDGSTPGNYMNDHPVGPSANPWCGGPYGWDCTANADGTLTYVNNSAQFLSDYYDVTTYGPIAHLVKVAGTHAGPGGGTATNSWVTCTTCHDQHDMSYFNAGPVGIKPTHFFVRGWYDPGNSATSNSAAQFCRTCHGGESNEMNGQVVPTQ
jgi:hypothetical protein